MAIHESRPGLPHTLADCVIYVAFAFVLVLVATYFPLIGLLASCVVTLPIIIMVLRRGVFWGATTALLVTVLAIFSIGYLPGIVAGLSVFGLGVAYGCCFQHQLNPAKTLFIVSVAVGLGTLVTVSLLLWLDIAFMERFLNSLENFFQTALKTYEEMGAANQLSLGGYTPSQYAAMAMALLRRLLPGLLACSALIVAALNYIFATFILRKLQFAVDSLPKFERWHLPWWLLWGMVVVLLAYLMGNYFNEENYFTIAQNILYLYAPIFFVSGLSVLAYLFHLWKFGKGIMVALCFLGVIFFTFSLPFILLMGAVDTLFDYRKQVEKARKNLHKK